MVGAYSERAIIFFQTWTEAFIVGELVFGVAEPKGVFSSQFFKLGRMRNRFSI